MLLLVLTGLGQRTTGQSFIQQLAREVCNCISAEELVYPGIQADRCVETVVNAHPRQIRAELQLSVRKEDDRRQLVALLIDPLADSCEALKALSADKQDRKLRYTDIPLARSNRSPAEKHPPADPRSTITAEAPELFSISGVILALSGEQLELRTDDNRTYVLQITDRHQRRRLDLETGKHRTVVYRLHWQIDPGAVVRILEDVK
ncbi:hypothetical protein CLV84_1083 [Neolewinella xylanilytica]|uniref:Uncharacterized protein n=2 Tax=Neolewinella xylanilytica TaxID=1514080 RepID=A0A2S6I9H0_9BACT|nr:hypothetical protein CLV84_1083 [Neolewinella xylanilytica]